VILAELRAALAMRFIFWIFDRGSDSVTASIAMESHIKIRDSMISPDSSTLITKSEPMAVPTLGIRGPSPIYDRGTSGFLWTSRNSEIDG
jgi:hypothetical protein